MPRRLRRHLLATLSALSLLLCAVTCVLWVWSYWRVAGLVHERDVNQISVGSEQGRIFLCANGFAGEVDRWPGFQGWEWGTEEADPSRTVDLPAEFRQFAGFAYVNLKVPPFYGGWKSRRLIALVIPYWFPVLVFGVAFAVCVRPIVVRRMRSRRDQCVSCGYDLRATPERCPECGTVAPT